MSWTLSHALKFTYTAANQRGSRLRRRQVPPAKVNPRVDHRSKENPNLPLSHTLSLALLSLPRYEDRAQTLETRQAWISKLSNKGSHQMSSDARSLAVRRAFMYLDEQKDAESTMDYEAPKGTNMRAGVNAKVSVVSEFTVQYYHTNYFQLLSPLLPMAPGNSCSHSTPLCTCQFSPAPSTTPYRLSTARTRTTTAAMTSTPPPPPQGHHPQQGHSGGGRRAQHRP